MGGTVGDAIKRVENRLKGELRNTAEHQGFVTALTGVLEELGPKSPVLEAGDERIVLELDRVTLVEAIQFELDRPAGKVRAAEKIADGIGALLAVHALEGELEEEIAGEHTIRLKTAEADGIRTRMARGVISRFDEAPAGEEEGAA